MRGDLCLSLALLLCCQCGTVDLPVLAPPHSEQVAQHPLSRADCEALALSSAPNAASFLARRLSAQAQLRQEKTWPNPVFAPSWDYLGFGHLIAEQTMSIGVSLASLLTRSTRISAAEHQAAAQVAELEFEIQELILEVRVGYDELIAARERVVANQTSVAVAEKVMAAVSKFFAAGTGTAVEVSQAEAALAEARLALDAVVADAELQQVAFAFALGFERPVALMFSEPMTKISTTEPAAQMIELAAVERQDLKAATARYETEIDRCHLANARPRFIPAIGGGPKFQGSQTYMSASLEVELPLFDLGGAAIAEQDAALLLSAAELRKTAQLVARDINLALAEQAAAHRHAYEHVLPLASLRMKLLHDQQRLFEVGEVTYANMIIAENDEATARVLTVDARLRCALAALRLQFAAGILKVCSPPIGAATER